MSDGGEAVGGRIIWVIAGLAAVYVVIHLPMLFRSLIECGRLVSALLGQ